MRDFFSKYFVFGLLAFVLFVEDSTLFAQNFTQIQLEKANSMQFDRSLGENVRRLIGEVVFRHEQSWMYCDSAYLYADENSLRAFSNVYIVDNDTIELWGNHLFYDGNLRIATLDTEVVMKDPEMTLYSDNLVYDRNLNTANYHSGGRIINADNELTSMWGFYYADTKEFFFKDKVVLTNPDYIMYSDTLKYHTDTEVAYFFGPTRIIGEENRIYCKNGWYDTRRDIAQFNKEAFLTNNEQSLTGDSVYYDRNLGYGKALMNVVLTDSVNNTFITGHFAEHFENEGVSWVSDRAVLTVVYEKDSLFMHADTLHSVYNKELDTRTLFAFNKAKFYRTDLQGLSDSIIYRTADSTLYMYSTPIIWTENNQMTANVIEVKNDGERVKTAYLYDAAFTISLIDSLHYDQIKGRDMVGHFREGELRVIEVFGNGETHYHLLDENTKRVNAINKVISSDLVIYIDERQVERIKLIDRPKGALYPPAQLPETEKFLKNFAWHIDRRPLSKHDIFTW